MVEVNRERARPGIPDCVPGVLLLHHFKLSKEQILPASLAILKGEDAEFAMKMVEHQERHGTTSASPRSRLAPSAARATVMSDLRELEDRFNQ
jgi:hypothetical protein